MDQQPAQPQIQKPPEQYTPPMNKPIIDQTAPAQQSQQEHAKKETGNSMQKIFCFLILGLLFLLVVVAGIYGASKLMQSKGKWICIDGEWVKEGNPKDQNPPSTPCSDVEEPNGDTQNGKLNIDAPLPTSPDDTLEMFELGDVKISTYNPVTITGLETSTNVYFNMENTSDETIKLSYIPEVQGNDTESIFEHLFWLFDKDTINLQAQQKKTLEFIAAPSGSSDSNGGTVPFTFQTNKNEELTIDLNVIFDQTKNFNSLPNTAVISGKVYNAIGTPISQAHVSLSLYNAYEQLTETTDKTGAYTFIIPSIDDVRAAMGNRPRPYDSLGYYLTVEKEGFEFGYEGEISPNRAETKIKDFNLDPFVDDIEFSELGVLKESGVYGYFWLMPVDDFDLLAAVQGRHPPELNKPGHIIAFDKQGNKQWKIKTKNECWGFDVSQAGLIAAACHDGMIYVTDKTGSILWQKDVGGQTREIEFSHKGDKILIGPYISGNTSHDFALLQANNGSIIWSGGTYDEWLRKAAFSPDDQRVVIGLSGGRLLEYSIQGELIWQKFIGEFPMILEVDNAYNVYAAGKNRELFSYDLLGALRFRKAIPNHVVSAGANNMNEDGDLIVMGTVGAHMYAFDPNGDIRWQREIRGELQGHNALDMTPSGNYIVVGSAGLQDGGWIQVFHKSGNLLWEKQYKDSRNPDKLEYTFDHNQSGVITVAISDDGEYIATGFGDSTIRIFQQEND